MFRRSETTHRRLYRLWVRLSSLEIIMQKGWDIHQSSSGDIPSDKCLGVGETFFPINKLQSDTVCSLFRFWGTQQLGTVRDKTREQKNCEPGSKAAIPALLCPAVWESMWGMIIPFGSVTQIAAGTCFLLALHLSCSYTEYTCKQVYHPRWELELHNIFWRIRKRIHKGNQKVKRSQKHINVICQLIHTKQTCWKKNQLSL